MATDECFAQHKDLEEKKETKAVQRENSVIKNLMRTVKREVVEELEDETDSLYQDELYSNQDLIKLKGSKDQQLSTQRKDRNDLDDLVNELLKDDSRIENKWRIVQKPNIKLPKLKACFDRISLFQEINTEELFEDLEFEQQIVEVRSEEAQKQQREESGAPSDSTEDAHQDSQSIGERFGDRFFREIHEQSSPQTQENTLDMNFNSHSQYQSDPGESKSLVDSNSNKKSKGESCIQASFTKNDQVNNLSRTIEQETSFNNFEIIRSNKNFNQVSSNSAVNPKKKQNGNGNKKKRSKAVGPQQNISSNKSTVDQSSRLNTFMRNMMFKDEVSERNQREETKIDVGLKTQQSIEIKEEKSLSQHLELPRPQQKTLYVKKTPQSDSSQSQTDSNRILPKRLNDDNLQPHHQPEVSSSQLLKPPEQQQLSRKLSHPQAKSKEDKIEKTQSQGVASRFEGFVNQRDNLNISDQQNKSYGANNGGSFKDTKKKKQQSNKNKSKNKYFGQGANAKNQKKPIKTTMVQPLPVITQVPTYADPSMNPYFFMNQVQPMPNQFIMQPQMQPPMMDYIHQPDFNPFFQDTQGGIQNLYQLLHQALIQGQATGFPVQPNQAFVDPYSQEDEYEQFDQKSEQFYSKMETQIGNLVKNIEKKLDSVMKEREQAVKIIEDIVNETYNKQYQSKNKTFVGVRMYGSMATKLAIEQSDVDLTVLGLNFKGQRELQIQEMQTFCELLDQFLTSKSSIQFIDSATVPVIKLQIDLSKIAKSIQRQEKNQQGVNVAYKEIDEDMRFLGVDITFEDSFKQQQLQFEGLQIANPGIQCISYIQELCKNQSDLKPIVLVLKKLLQNHGLNHPYHGGLNSYSLVLITSAFLHRFNVVESISKNLVEFLRYFGYFFDPQTTVVENQDFTKVASILTDPMTVIDPLSKGNNTTRSSFRIREIQQIFKRAYELLMSRVGDSQKEEIDVIQLLLSKENDYAVPRDVYP